MVEKDACKLQQFNCYRMKLNCIKHCCDNFQDVILNEIISSMKFLNEKEYTFTCIKPKVDLYFYLNVEIIGIKIDNCNNVRLEYRMNNGTTNTTDIYNIKLEDLIEIWSVYIDEHTHKLYAK